MIIQTVDLGDNYVNHVMACLPKFKYLSRSQFRVTARCIVSTDPMGQIAGRYPVVLNTDMGDMAGDLRGKWTSSKIMINSSASSGYGFECITNHSFEDETDAIAMKMAADAGNCTIVFPT